MNLIHPLTGLPRKFADTHLRSVPVVAAAANLGDPGPEIANRKSEIGNPMQPFLLSSARDRWMSQDLRSYTPDRVMAILRGAFSGDLTAQWELFDLMESTEPRIQKNLAELKQVLEDHDWPLQAYAEEGQEPSKEAIRRKRIVSEVVWRMDADPTLDESDFSDLCRDLADAWGKGVALQELDWTDLPFEGGTILGLKAARWVHPRYYGYPNRVDKADRLMLNVAELTRTNPQLGATLADYAQRGLIESDGQWATVPRDKFLVGVAKQKTGHPIGGALLRPLAWWWAVANFSSEWLVNLAQIFGVPIRWATYAVGAPPDQIRKIEDMLENMGSASWAAFPAGTALELKDAVKAGTDNPQVALLGIIHKIYDLLILGQSTTGDAAGEKGGGMNSDNTSKKAILSGRKLALLKWSAKTLNAQLIPAICRMNFGDLLEMPYFVVGEEEEEDAKMVADTYKVVLDSGVAIPKKHYYDSVGIPMPEPGEDVIEGRGQQMPDPGSLMPDAGGRAAGQRTQGGPIKGQAMFGREGRERFFSYPGVIVQAQSAQDRLAAHVAESVTGVSAEWLGGALPYFRQLVGIAENPDVSDAEFVAFVDRARRGLPQDVAPYLRPQAVAEALEDAMGASLVNGAVAGYLGRPVPAGGAR